MATNDSVQKYFEALLASYDILTEAVDKANERGLKVTKQLAADIIKGQREAIEMGKSLAAKETPDASAFYSAVLETATAAQSRALAFTQAAYQEAVSSGTDARDTVEKLVEANKLTSKAAMDAAKSWSAAKPFADIIKKNFDAMTPPAMKKEKTATK